MRELLEALRRVPLDLEIVVSLEPGEKKGFLVPLEAARLAPVVRDREVTNPRWYLPALAAESDESENRTEEFLIVLYPR